ncbi:hypothetical protein NLI96_g12325 [Meripilus lineatus]|uniref:Uncharacterized protein n=1 Tax=Meripilus lineatus TaxID=2056292 RepID=A0AAD5UQ44_9APHY|nr:hypothetical protein NLI96_g12325 [Physisporinus lineatus]
MGVQADFLVNMRTGDGAIAMTAIEKTFPGSATPLRYPLSEFASTFVRTHLPSNMTQDDSGNDWMSEVGIRDLELTSTLEMMKISPDHYNFGRALLDIRYNYLLHPYTDRPSDLRRLLTLTNSVISGSTAVKFLSPIGDWPTGDMDIYTYGQANADRLISFFQGARYIPVFRPAPRRRYPEMSPGFITVVSLVRPASAGGRKIDIIISEHHSALFPISKFWNTFLFNFLTGDALCIAYPELTLLGHGYIRGIGMAHPRLEMLKEKYAARGYTSREPDSLELGFVLPKTRRFGDEDCMVIRLGGISGRDGIAREKILALGDFTWE